MGFDRASAAIFWTMAIVTMSLFLMLVNGQEDPLNAVILVSLSVMSVLALHGLMAANRRAFLGKRLREGLMDCFYRLLYYKSKKGSYLLAIDKVAQGADSAEIRSMISRASRRFKLGGSFLDYIVSQETFRKDRLMSSLQISDVTGVAAVRNAVCAYELRVGSTQADIEESLQRFAVLNMFLSTIVPSFLVFAFIGSAIMSQATLDLMLFSVILIVIIPVFYAAGNTMMWRRLFA